MPKKPWKIISVGGSIIIPKTGFNVPFLVAFRELILSEVRQGGRFMLIIGGGATARAYQQAAMSVLPGLSNEKLDRVGIHATVLNARFVQSLFGDSADSKIITNPTRKLKTIKPIIVGAGWKPGCSTDNDAVLLARTYGVKHILNLSNISYLYDKDPAKHPDARKIEDIDWTTFRRDIVGREWQAGTNVPFDPVASAAAERSKITVAILSGTDLSAVGAAIKDWPFAGTVIHP
ncbi:MAG: UMP kinase [Candidatus Magasanikbacteria bacterium]|nr:UMP kinase [Candidatus Magasanikbacteria bacterium]